MPACTISLEPGVEKFIELADWNILYNSKFFLRQWSLAESLRKNRETDYYISALQSMLVSAYSVLSLLETTQKKKFDENGYREFNKNNSSEINLTDQDKDKMVLLTNSV